MVDPKVAHLIGLVLTDPATSYLGQPAYAATLHTWATAQARVEIFAEWLFVQPIEAQLRPPRGGAKSPLDTWLTMVRTAATLADRLGLTPLSRARLGRDVAVAEVAEASLERMAEQGRQALAGRGVVEVEAPGLATPAGVSARALGRRVAGKGKGRRGG